METYSAFTTGMVTSIALIMAIGAQNAFVLAQGIKKQYNFEIALVCCSLDALLIFAGVAGMGLLISTSPVLLWCIALLGAVFLSLYGAKAFSAVFSNQSLKAETRGFKTLYQALLVTASISLLNPHVYLDTVVLIGSVGGQYPSPEQWWFAAGASLSSILWFFSLSYGAARLAPVFAKPGAWKVLDSVVCVMMWAIAYYLWNTVIEKFPTQVFL
jgi:L-lysine exporter family protein LysE/ArgO